MPLEALYFEFCGKSYDRYAKTAQHTLTLYKVLFKLDFKSCVVVIGFHTVNKSVWDFLGLNFRSQFEVTSISYELFSFTCTKPLLYNLNYLPWFILL